MKKHEELFRHRNGLCDCGEKTDTTQTTPSEEWESELRNYISTFLKPKKQTIGNLDREVIINFVRNLRTAAYEKGARDAKRVAVLAIYSSRTLDEIKETGSKEELSRSEAVVAAQEAISTLLK